MQLNDDAGTFVSVPSLLASPSAVSASSVPVVRFDNGKRSYSGVLAFSTSDHVVQGIKHIAEQLMDKGYQIKFTYKENSTDANLELTLARTGLAVTRPRRKCPPRSTRSSTRASARTSRRTASRR
ncbi:hypothetical protein SCP_0602610 [Sparassis crispa]|uniref:Uncharacterized protein n=1 Tax=Sparassis crispa TaxID=139825 RepID=A0A401GPY8_9APHY|nr:hypothetical protein SCP_0602610 [Sparassis crispa]GBE84283.1 hypothetical protein SCP_0602610 [Sparassis crispa]